MPLLCNGRETTDQYQQREEDMLQQLFHNDPKYVKWRCYPSTGTRTMPSTGCTWLRIVGYWKTMGTFLQAGTAQLNRLAKLQKRRQRHEWGLFVIEGHRAVMQVVEQGLVNLRETYVTESYLDAYGDRHVPSPCYVLSEKDFQRIADSESPQGILAVADIPAPAHLQDYLGQKGCILALDRIQDPGNMGTMLRSAAWFGAELILVGEGSVDLWNPKVVRSTAGATGSIACLECDLGSALPTLENAGWEVALLDGNPGSSPLGDLADLKRVVIVVGNEAQGISALLSERFRRYRIDSVPGQRAAESLNASVAAGIALYVLSESKIRSHTLS